MTATCSVTKHKHRSRKSTNMKYASCKEKLFFYSYMLRPIFLIEQLDGCS